MFPTHYSSYHKKNIKCKIVTPYLSNMYSLPVFFLFLAWFGIRVELTRIPTFQQNQSSIFIELFCHSRNIPSILCLESAGQPREKCGKSTWCAVGRLLDCSLRTLSLSLYCFISLPRLVYSRGGWGSRLKLPHRLSPNLNP